MNRLCRDCAREIQFAKSEDSGLFFALHASNRGAYVIEEDDSGQRWAKWAGPGKGTHDNHLRECGS